MKLLLDYIADVDVADEVSFIDKMYLIQMQYKCKDHQLLSAFSQEYKECARGRGGGSKHSCIS